MEDFSPYKALHYAESIAYPRAVGTPGEITARDYIASLLEGMGLHVDNHPFEFSSAAGSFLKMEILTSQLLILMSVGLLLFYPSLAFIPVILLVLIIVLSSPINRSVQAYSLAPRSGESPPLMSRLVYSRGERFSTTNIIAEFPDRVDSPGAPQLLLVAHLDTKSQRISLITRITLFVISISGGILFAILTILGFFLSGSIYISAVIGAVVLIASIPLLFLDYGDASPGAIDDASGVGLLLHLAELLAADTQIREKLNITFLISSAEELATMGTAAYVKDYAAVLRKQARRGGLHVMNFDGVGVQGDLYQVAPRRSAATEIYPSLREVIRDACAHLGFKLRRFVLPGALFDHIPFAEAGFDAVSLIAIGKDSRYVHTSRDSADKLDPRGFGQAGRVAMKVIERLSQMSDTNLT